LIIGLVLFFAVHSISVAAPTWRDRVVEHMGRPLWMTLYSLASLLGLWLIIRGYAQARAEPTVWYTPAAWMYSAGRLLMLPVFPLLLAAYLPGTIRRATRHPVLVAIKAWAVAHLLANGMAADVLLFGGFLAWAVIDRVSLQRRPERRMRTLPERRINDTVAVVGGLVLYALFAGYLHARWFGVSPFGF
jgi:uncharacterized membrane protein